MNTAFPDAAQYGTGSGVVVALKEPRIAVVGETGISQTSYGAVWWSLEQRYGIKVVASARAGVDERHGAWNGRRDDRA